jgi:hypothetical protein
MEFAGSARTVHFLRSRRDTIAAIPMITRDKILRFGSAITE